MYVWNVFWHLWIVSYPDEVNFNVHEAFNNQRKEKKIINQHQDTYEFLT